MASGFVFRVAAGVTLVAVERFSPWLYVVTTLLALFIGFGKRRAELALLAGTANQHRTVFEGYSLDFLDQLITIVSGATIIGYSLYTFSAPNLPANHTMMLTIPFVLYGIFRYLYLIKVKESGGAPEELLMKDRASSVNHSALGFECFGNFLSHLNTIMPSFSISVPGKTILFGEHAVVYGYPAIAVPLDSISLNIKISARPDRK